MLRFIICKKIELQTSENAITALLRDMARKYTLLVKNHSLQGYSKFVRKVLVHVDLDLSADLTLSTQAKLLDVNPSYYALKFRFHFLMGHKAPPVFVWNILHKLPR